MTNEEAARILDPKTTLEVYAETEYYSGFDGAKRWKEAVDEACIIGAKALREQSGTDTNVGGKWISVKDELPDKFQDVLCFFPNKDFGSKIEISYFESISGVCADTHRYKAPTHWQPLPAKPTE